jgi:hypothetical protein
MRNTQANRRKRLRVFALVTLPFCLLLALGATVNMVVLMSIPGEKLAPSAEMPLRGMSELIFGHIYLYSFGAVLLFTSCAVSSFYLARGSHLAFQAWRVLLVLITVWILLLGMLEIVGAFRAGDGGGFSILIIVATLLVAVPMNLLILFSFFRRWEG